MDETINIHEHIRIWNQAVFQIMDIRHIHIQNGDDVRPYLLPSSAYLYVTHGSASVTLDDAEHTAKPYYLLHGGKGAYLDIRLTDHSFQYYLILYKASLPPSGRRYSLGRTDIDLPFSLQYGFIPLHPAILYQLAERMLDEWLVEERLERLHAKTLFYQFVYELLQQMDEQRVSPVRPDLISQIIRYIGQHYAEPITRDSLARIFNYSVPYLSKYFRRETGTSMIDYLIRIRMNQAGDLLQKTDLSMQEIARSIGYTDVSYFIRLFKKTAGVTPGELRNASLRQANGSYRPIIRLQSSIAPRRLRHYIGNRDDNHYQYSGKGDLPMYKSKLPVGVTLLLCLTLLLSACARPANTNGGASNVTEPGPKVSTSSNTANAAAKNTNGSSETITFKAVNGDIQIPKNPQRIVMVAGAFTGHLLALGLKPVATGDESFNNYTEGKLDDVVNLGNDIPYEQIIELQPDLIVVWNDPAAIEKLTQIAPTVAVDYGIPFREQLMDFGTMTGREEQAKAWIEAWDAQIAKYKPLVKQAVGERTISIFDAGSAKEFYAYGSFGRGGDIIYGEFGLKAPPIIQKEAIDSGQGWAKLSLELLPEYAGDYIFISGWTGEENAAWIFEGNIWDSLPAVKNNHVYRENSRGFVFSDPISLEAQLQFVVDSLLGKK
ncbi:ABC transporter substrate-binding protein [Paenibacillus sp. FSL R7-277]|uniref:AraC family transcriptional regulator n=1 Tax=Paenibacillus sp. FSL R7-277 TaxID=1227352 RepID=UPI0003E22A33|nr:AraC family transcriptional regulator [Paenibacillus sp. FSL R7-277]ETT63212.1 ABC transporter substrate-binding protein [Paenibacillus sp. FSL R7-277]